MLTDFTRLGPDRFETWDPKAHAWQEDRGFSYQEIQLAPAARPALLERLGIPREFWDGDVPYGQVPPPELGETPAPGLGPKP